MYYIKEFNKNYCSDNFISNFLYIAIGLIEENRKKANSFLFNKSLEALAKEFHVSEHKTISGLYSDFNSFIVNRMNGLKKDIEVINKNIGVRDGTNDRCAKFFELYKEAEISSLIKEYHDRYTDIALKGVLSEESTSELLSLIEIIRQIEEFCKKMRDLELEFLEYNQLIWDARLTDITNFDSDEDYHLLIHRMSDNSSFFKSCDQLSDWVKAENGFLCASYITNKLPNIYNMNARSHIAAYGFVLKMDVNRLASMSRKDNYTNYSFLGQGLFEYRTNHFNPFKSIFTKICSSSPLDTSVTKTPAKLLNNCGLCNEIIFDFQTSDTDLITGVFCLIDQNITHTEDDLKFIQELKNFSNRVNLRFMSLLPKVPL